MQEVGDGLDLVLWIGSIVGLQMIDAILIAALVLALQGMAGGGG